MSARGAARWLCAFACLGGGAAEAQDFGHKLLGTLGLQAGSQPPTGLYLSDRLLYYDAESLFDRNGTRIHTEISLHAVVNGVGVAWAYRVAPLHTFVNAAAALPVARVTGSAGGVEGSIDKLGLADAYLQPLKLGWRLPRLDLQVGYALYVPTGRFEPGGTGGVSRGSFSHELSTGGTVYFDSARSWQLGALASYECNERKIGLDLTRGSTVQVQGGAGKTLLRLLDVGLVYYALWQVTDDRGSALPPVLRGARDRAVGGGGELGVTVRETRCRVALRYTHDFAVRSRPLGQLGLFALSCAAWKP